MKHLKSINELNQEINWSEIESKWDDYIEETNNETDYDDQFDELKSFLSGKDIPWKEVKKDYFSYIEKTNNEDDYDVKFRNFKKIVNKHIKN